MGPYALPLRYILKITVRMIPVIRKAKYLFFLLNIKISDGIITNSKVAYMEDVRADSTL